MSTQPIPEIIALLRQFNALPHGRDEQLGLAAKIAHTGRILTTEGMDLLTKHFNKYRPVGVAVTMAVRAALADGSWIELAQGLRDEERDAEHPGSQTQMSGLQFVTADNPYGWWRDPDWEKPGHFDRLKRHAEVEPREEDPAGDHNIPDKWNAYRQCSNLTVQEKREAGATDYRRRGCSRVEVIGGLTIPPGWRPGQKLPEPPHPIRYPKVFYDHQEVLDAIAAETNAGRQA